MAGTSKRTTETLAAYQDPRQPPEPALKPCDGCGTLVCVRLWLSEAHPPRWKALPWPVTPLTGYLHLCPALPMPACTTCGHEAADHVTGLCLHTLECLCKGYVPQQQEELR
jgi:hypothetical protein